MEVYLVFVLKVWHSPPRDDEPFAILSCSYSEALEQEVRNLKSLCTIVIYCFKISIHKALETPNSKEIITPKPGGTILLVQTKCTWILPKTEEGDGGRCSWFQGSSKQCRCIKSYPGSSIGLILFGLALGLKPALF